MHYTDIILQKKRQSLHIKPPTQFYLTWYTRRLSSKTSSYGSFPKKYHGIFSNANSHPYTQKSDELLSFLMILFEPQNCQQDLSAFWGIHITTEIKCYIPFLSYNNLLSHNMFPIPKIKNIQREDGRQKSPVPFSMEKSFFYDTNIQIFTIKWYRVMY